MDIEEAKEAIKLEQAQQYRIPYSSRNHTLLWFIRNLDEAIKEIEKWKNQAESLRKASTFKKDYDPKWDHAYRTLEAKYNNLKSEIAALNEAALYLDGNIKCTNCGAVYPNPHIYPCNQRNY